MSYSPQPYSPSLSDDDYYDYYDDHPAVPSANYAYDYVSDYSYPSDHYVRIQSERSEGVSYSDEEERQPSSASWHAFPSVESPILAVPEPAPDYARMSMLSETPPPSNVSIHTYLTRFTNFLKKIHKMPWKAERVTADYYPEKNIQRRRARNLFQEDWYDRDAKEITAVSWRSRRYVERQQGMHDGYYFETVVGGNGRTTSPYLGSLESTKSPSSSTGVIEPFPFTSIPPEDTRRTHVTTT